VAQNLTDIMDRLEAETQDASEVAIRDVLAGFRDRTFGPLILAVGLLAITPLGAIPLVPTFLALLLVLVVGQKLIGFEHPWVPRELRERSVDRAAMCRAFARARPWARRIDKVLKPRLTVLVEGPMTYVTAGLALLLALTMPPLELVPFAVFVPGLGVVLLGLAASAKDGALAVVAIAFAGGAVWLVVWWFVFREG